MKLNRIALAVGALVLTGSAAAELSANIGATSNYVWRGVTQTDDGPAISGGVDYAHDSGFYAGIWASNVNFRDAVDSDGDPEDNGQAEVDLYAGFANELDMGLGYDVGVIYYGYPQADEETAGGGEDELDFTEIYATLSYGPVSGGVAYTVDTEAGGDDDHVYYHLGAGFDVAEGWSIGGTVGLYDFDGGSEYTHGQLDLSKDAGDFGEFTLSVSSVFDDDDADVDEDLLVFVSWGKTFD